MALALLIITVDPFAYMTDKSTGIPALDYVLTMFVGGRSGVSLCFLPNFAYALFGVWFGRMLRRTSDKKAFYRCLLPGACVIAIGYGVYAFLNNDSLESLYRFVGQDYVCSGTFRMLANLSFTLIAAAVLYFLHNKIASLSMLDRALLHLSRKTSQYYAIHPFFYSLVFSLSAVESFGWGACFALTAVNALICYLATGIWKRFCDWRTNRRSLS